MKFALPAVMFLIMLSCNNAENNKVVKPVEDLKTETITTIHPEWTEALITNNLTGSVHVWDKTRNTLHHSDSSLFDVTNVPASTFKIFLTLMALEQGIVKDENEVWKWDEKKQSVESWNHDQNMTEAFANSTNWFYQNINDKIDTETMKSWLNKADYGCTSIDGKEKYWLEPGFEISPAQQFDFLKRLHDDDLPFSQRSMDVTKKIMLRKDTLGVKIYGKTGWGVPNGINVGWYVGWAEKDSSTFYFATCIEQPEPASKNFADLRISTIYNALTSLGVLSSSNHN